MHQYHYQLLTRIKKAAKGGVRSSHHSGGYHGTTHVFYNLKTAVKRDIAKKFKKEHPDLSFVEYVSLINSLNKGKSYEEKTIAATLLDLYKQHKKHLHPQYLDRWLENLEGWAETDSLCQSMFSADELLSRWRQWKKLLLYLARSSNPIRQRARNNLGENVIINNAT